MLFSSAIGWLLESLSPSWTCFKLVYALAVVILRMPLLGKASIRLKTGLPHPDVGLTYSNQFTAFELSSFENVNKPLSGSCADDVVHHQADSLLINGSSVLLRCDELIGIGPSIGTQARVYT